MNTDIRSNAVSRQLVLLFFLSGFSALIYQVAWQRKLFSTIGIDVVSVAIIVSAFMFGLGVGGAMGGYLADRVRNLVRLFSCLEMGIGLFGFGSIALIAWLAEWLPTANLLSISAFSLLVLLIPTVLMGATLPILVLYVNRSIDNVGVSTGTLYFSNTMGAALGAFATGFVFFDHFTLSQTTIAAAGINFLVALAAWSLREQAP